MTAKKPVSAKPQNVFLATSSTELEPFRAAKKKWSKQLLSRSTGVSAARAFAAAVSPEPLNNVVGVGIGEKLVDGKTTGIRAIKFFVRVKFPESALGTSQTLPKIVDGLPTDVEEVGLFRRFAKSPVKKKPVAKPTTTMPNPRVKIRPLSRGVPLVFKTQAISLSWPEPLALW